MMGVIGAAFIGLCIGLALVAFMSAAFEIGEASREHPRDPNR